MAGGPLDRLRHVAMLLRDPRVGKLPRYLVLLAVVYLVSPVDFVPEILTPVFGFLDDAVLLWLSLRWLIKSDPNPPPSARVVDVTDRTFRP
jgi:uncharacterized membrane protein YkvA (DUF1232 family)